MAKHDVAAPIRYTALSNVPQGNEAYAREGSGRTQAALHRLWPARPNAKRGHARLDRGRIEVATVSGAMKLNLTPKVLVLNRPDNASAFATAKLLAQRLGVEILVKDSEGAELAIVRPQLDS
jgi:hypothetical protein